ncbi:type II CAAX endopeptidase family protein [Dyadobacter sp. CY323]|uniref:type II CAAX endopeptidase family protein n=1 Tax=Dyadobacter sp. CY323 TaxID=2907302 RepID=UPI001F2CB0EC|nr:type II CAAX endopeptidase family protein [Dyadobacter sp. CY323]MCE6991522.1 CPBP family intramembrane metalloprotease [Dyadobacter sp. CY323]
MSIENKQSQSGTSKSESRKAIGIFLLLTFALSSVVWILTINSGEGRIGGRIYGYGIMWCPALATWLTCRILNYKISDLAWQWGKPKYQAWAYFVPVAYSLIAYLIIWLAGWGGFYNKEFVTEAAKSLGWAGLSPGVFIPLFFVVNGVIGLFGSMSTALGEEIGWRGFLVPHLNDITSYTYTSLISGMIWAFWHYPLIIWGHYNGGTPIWYGLTCFTVAVVSASFIYTWFRLKSGSLWTGVMLHASHNLFIQTFFTPVTIVSSPRTNYFIDEFGAVLAVVSLFAAIYFWSRRQEVL